MLLPDNINPKNSVYYNGAMVLKELQLKDNQQLLDLFLKIKATHTLSFSLFILCLDWLFLINTVQIDNGGVISLCS